MKYEAPHERARQCRKLWQDKTPAAREKYMEIPPIFRRGVWDGYGAAVCQQDHFYNPEYAFDEEYRKAYDAGYADGLPHKGTITGPVPETHSTLTRGERAN